MLQSRHFLYDPVWRLDFRNNTKYDNGRKLALALHDFLPFVSEG